MRTFRGAAIFSFVTDDNPRSEPPAAIRAEILAGAPGAREIGDTLEPGDSFAAYTCVVSEVDEGFVNVAVATGTPAPRGSAMRSTRSAASRLPGSWSTATR